MVFCDESGKTAVCETCGQVHSPYWDASRSAALHRRGTGHEVTVMPAGKALTLLLSRGQA